MSNAHPVSPLGKVRLAITMEDMLLFRGVPMPRGYSSLAIAQAMTAALNRHRVHGVPVDDRAPKILDEIETLNVMPGESAAEIRARQLGLLAQHLKGAKPAPVPLANIQC